MERTQTRMKLIIISICCEILATFVTAFGPGGGVGAPGGGGAPGAPSQIGSISGRQSRLISSGGTEYSTDGGVIDSAVDKDTSSPQQRPDGPPFETGVQDAVRSRATACGSDSEAAFQQLLSKSSSTQKSDKICLELVCAFRCPNGYVERNGCLTCDCLQFRSTLTSSCPVPPIEAMWYIRESDSIGIATRSGMYQMREDATVSVSSTTLTSHLETGGLCGSTIDASFTTTLDLKVGKREYSVFFSGKFYSIYKDSYHHVTGPHAIDRKYEGGSKTPLQLTFPWYVEKIDAVMKWQGNQKVYFFFKYLGTGYYSKYNPKTNRMYKNYPRRTMDWWKGLPKEGPDSAYSSPSTGKTYFVVGDDLYVMDKGRSRVTSDSYPEPVMDNFIGCDDNV